VAGRDVEAEEAATDAPSRRRGPPPPLLPPTEVGAKGPTHRPGGGGGWVGDWGVVWTSLGPLPRWVPGPTTRWAPGTTRLALQDT
jgi:hypothetical protein